MEIVLLRTSTSPKTHMSSNFLQGQSYTPHDGVAAKPCPFRKECHLGPQTGHVPASERDLPGVRASAAELRRGCQVSKGFLLLARFLDGTKASSTRQVPKCLNLQSTLDTSQLPCSKCSLCVRFGRWGRHGLPVSHSVLRHAHDFLWWLHDALRLGSLSGQMVCPRRGPSPRLRGDDTS